MIRCCIFDLDGTLIYTAKALMTVMNKTLEELGFPFIDEARTKAFVGNGSDKYVERALISLGDKELKYYERACKIYREKFKLYALYGIEAYEGIEELLQKLKDRGISLCVLSNKPQKGVEDNVSKVFGTKYFDNLYGERAGIAIKPDPGVLNLIIKEKELKKDEVLYIGDSDIDVYTGINAGVKTVAVTWGYRSLDVIKEAKPDFIIDRAEELIGIIDNF